jgi:hypothetical protein
MGFCAREWLALWGWGDLSPDEKPHLRYPSVWRWLQAEGVPLPLACLADPDERARRQREYEELWRYLFVHHLAGLPEAEQQLFRDGRHPSQSHDRSEAAEPVAELLRGELAARGISAEVSVGRYFDGRTVLDVFLPEWPLAGQWPDDLSFFHGFEAHVCSRAPGWSPPEAQGQANPSLHLIGHANESSSNFRPASRVRRLPGLLVQRCAVARRGACGSNGETALYELLPSF